MAYLVDTNILIHARDGTESVLRRFEDHDGAILLSALSLAELHRGLTKNSVSGALRRARFDAVMQGVPVLPFDAEAAEAYGRIIAQCGWVRGRDFDRMIAGHAMAAHATLVTANEADFRDIPHLRLENWVKPATV